MSQAKPNCVSLSELFPGSNVHSIKTGSELYLIYMLDKYCHIFMNKSLDIEGLTVDKHILKSPYMAFLRQRAFMTHINLPFLDKKEEFAWLQSHKLNNIFTADDLRSVVPTAQDDNAVEYSFVYDVKENRIMRYGAIRLAYVNLVAMNIVYNFANNKHRIILINNSQATPKAEEYNDLIVLRDFGNKLLTPNICLFTFAEGDKTQPDYEAWVAYHKQRGYINPKKGSYDSKEKFRAAKAAFPVGTPVLVYRRKKTTKNLNLHEPYNSCTLAVVREISEQGITVDEIPAPETKLTQKKSVEALIAANPTCYSVNDIYTFHVAAKTYTWNSVGIGAVYSGESVLMTEVFEEDGTKQWFTDGVNTVCVEVNTRETVYAVLVDRKIPFNREKYLQKYFVPFNKVPVYDQWAQRAAANAQNS